jgi:hypothetical protein
MVAFIVLVSVVGGLLRLWIKSRTAGHSGLSLEQQSRLARLEERVKSLEAVVGDSSYELKQKFKDLERS